MLKPSRFLLMDATTARPRAAAGQNPIRGRWPHSNGYDWSSYRQRAVSITRYGHQHHNGNYGQSPLHAGNNLSEVNSEARDHGSDKDDDGRNDPA
jgi:hypothetical protein